MHSPFHQRGAAPGERLGISGRAADHNVITNDDACKPLRKSESVRLHKSAVKRVRLCGFLPNIRATGFFRWGIATFGRKAGFDDMDEKEFQKRLELLRTEHRDLDAAITALTEAGSTDQLQIARLKKRKLRLKDQIAIIEDTLLPDIIA